MLCAHADKKNKTRTNKRSHELGDGKEGGGDGSQYVIGVEKQREQVTVGGSGAPCVVDRHEARSSLLLERTAYVSHPRTHSSVLLYFKYVSFLLFSSFSSP